MKTIVLDKSAVKAARKGVLANLRSEFDFLLLDTLLHEIATEKMDKRDSLSEPDQTKLDQKIRANFRRTIKEAGNLWIDNETALSWEIEKGSSAKEAPRFSLRTEPSIDMLSDKNVKKDCLDYDARKGQLVSVVHAPEDSDGFDEIQCMDEEKLFRKIERDYSSDAVLQRVAKEAKDGFSMIAATRGLRISPQFRPQRDWFSYGMTLASKSFLPWKFWKFGDRQADSRNPPNPYFDMVYRGYVAIADGILSADKDMLKLVWACWPEKRRDTYFYDMQEHQIIVFEPEWSS